MEGQRNNILQKALSLYIGQVRHNLQPTTCNPQAPNLSGLQDEQINTHQSMSPREMWTDIDTCFSFSIKLTRLCPGAG